MGDVVSSAGPGRSADASASLSDITREEESEA